MSTIPSHDSPSNQCQGQDTEHSHWTSYEMYSNRGQHAVEGGIINNYQYNPSTNPLEELRKHCSPSAAFDSAARFDSPRCAESTRLGIIQIIEEWINGDEDEAMPSSLFWLHGGAGAGKSALAQSLSENFQNKGLAASFFFFRSDPNRNNGNHLIPTVISQLASTYEESRPLIEDRIRKNWDIFTKRYHIQIQELLTEPLLSLKSKAASAVPPRIIIIDGLDECANPNVQCELLRAIARAIPYIPYPLRFLITSRPEAHITHVFNHDRDLQTIRVHQYNLSDDPDADMDIRKFLQNEFMEIRRVHRLGEHLPLTWPDSNAINSLVERSSGHFIYASTVIRYIQSPKHRPDDRLEVILHIRPPQKGDKPYAQLDALYALIFEVIDDRDQLEKICLVLGILYFRSVRLGIFANFFNRYTMEALLEMRPGDLVLLLDPVLSLVAIYDHGVRVLHKSLFDYLLDSSRGGHLPLDFSRVHGAGATYILKQEITKNICDEYNYRKFAFHCRHGYLDDALRGYLQSLEVPHLCKAPQLDQDLQMLWDFMRTLNREDFDSTGQIHRQYIAKWLDYFQSVVPSQTQHPSGAPAAKGASLKGWFKRQNQVPTQQPGSINVLKEKIDTVLREWKPQGFKMGVRIDPTRQLAYIEQEYRVFLAYAKASFSGDAKAIVSSLVSSDNFTHTYGFIPLSDGSYHLFVQTYSRDGRAFARSAWSQNRDLVAGVRWYVKHLEKKRFADIYQKYGIEPET